MKWFNQEPSQIIEHFESSIEKGLSQSQAESRLQECGPNELAETAQMSTLSLFLVQFKNPMLIILAIGGLLSVLGGHLVDGIAILVIVVANALITFIQELGAKKSLDSLREMGAPNALVLRDGEWQKLPVKTLVPGDIVKLNTGDVVGADIRLLAANQLQIDESALTGESEPVEKNIELLHAPELGIGDRINLVFTSTIVTAGNGTGVVVDTGMNTEVGHIANLMQTAESVETPMQRRLNSLSHALIGVAVAAVAIVVGIGLYNGADWLEMLQTGISLSVAAIPEGLPTIVTIVLTMGAKHMARGNARIRQLASVETLGSTTVICSDKTGTLTQNQMQVVAYWSGGKTFDVTGQGFEPVGRFLDENDEELDLEQTPELKYGLIISAICNDAELQEKDGRYSIQGNPTEGALVVAGTKVGIYRDALFEEGFQLIKSFPFDSKRKMASSVIRGPLGRYWLIAKGAPDVLLNRSNAIYWNNEAVSLNDDFKQKIHTGIDAFGKRALRTLALAFVEITEADIDKPQEEHEQDLTFLAMHGIIDPPRPEVVEAVAQCTDAGIRTVMITGDHAATAQAIATELGIRKSDQELVVTGPQLEEISDRKLRELAPTTSVFARVSPEHKQRIVKALQANDEVVAMTGDGVNDAPALRNADIGIAMGIAGTQVAKDSADLVLLDDNFSTIVLAVKEGRRIYDNIRKYLRAGLTANVSEVSCVLFAFLLMANEPLVPLTALMILWINMLADAMPSLCLGWEKQEADLMTRKPRKRNESFFAEGLGARILVRGLIHGYIIYALFQFVLSRGGSVEYAQTIAFVSLIFIQNFHLLDARSFKSIYRLNPFENKLLITVLVAATGSSLALIYSPLGGMILGTVAISAKHLLMTAAIAALPTFVLSGIKELFGVKWL
ncbi:cation-translocating P-type ATPase [Teredinibacter franksiae]|uniref:cation-translocating P-type ATPase n=1 Tax=Teredinibacter franksiae TaxID=2761453 RepID=UPI0016277750|nr:cation-transporting P-type ATPase [Teredinibacter franksiae]